MYLVRRGFLAVSPRRRPRGTSHPSNLGLADTILWLVKGGMHWSDLLPTFQFAMLFNSKPVLIVINVGGNDLVTIKQAKFIRVINRDLKVSLYD